MASSNRKVIYASDKLRARDSGPWARQKLAVLSYFMDQFTVGMKPSKTKSHNWDHLVYIDLFAGPGKCIDRETGSEFDGSPLRALKARYPFSKIYLVESFPQNCLALSERIRNEPNGEKCELLKMNCNRAIKRILQDQQPNTLYLAFIDPEGLDIDFDSIRTLTEGKPCDLIINWFVSAIKRNVSQWFSKRESEKFDRFMGTKSWKNVFDQSMGSREILQSWVNLYREQLTSIGYTHQGQPLVLTNTKNGELYWLWFASKHRRGVQFWDQARTRGLDQPEFLF